MMIEIVIEPVIVWLHSSSLWPLAAFSASSSYLRTFTWLVLWARCIAVSGIWQILSPTPQTHRSHAPIGVFSLVLHPNSPIPNTVIAASNWIVHSFISRPFYPNLIHFICGCLMGEGPSQKIVLWAPFSLLLMIQMMMLKTKSNKLSLLA